MKNYYPNQGFTIIELMVVVAIVAILSMMAVPNFTNMIRSNAITAQSNLFTSAINTARSEAVTRNAVVVLCKRSASSPATCDNSASWRDGWVIFVDENRDRASAASEVLRVFDPIETGYVLTADNAVNEITFDSTGALQRTSPVTSATFSLCSPDAVPANGRTISLNLVGRANLTKGATACPST